MRPKHTAKGQIIDLTPLCRGSINRPKRRKIGMWPAMIGTAIFWGAFLAYVYHKTH